MSILFAFGGVWITNHAESLWTSVARKCTGSLTGEETLDGYGLSTGNWWEGEKEALSVDVCIWNMGWMEGECNMSRRTSITRWYEWLPGRCLGKGNTVWPFWTGQTSKRAGKLVVEKANNEVLCACHAEPFTIVKAEAAVSLVFLIYRLMLKADHLHSLFLLPHRPSHRQMQICTNGICKDIQTAFLFPLMHRTMSVPSWSSCTWPYSAWAADFLMRTPITPAWKTRFNVNA